MSFPAGVACRALVPPCTGEDTAVAPEDAVQVQPVSPLSKPGLTAMLAAWAGDAASIVPPSASTAIAASFLNLIR